jgi:DNA modification methylase
MARKKKADTDYRVTYKSQAEARATAGAIPVFCAYDKLVNPLDLRGNPRNPNKHPKEQIKLLAHIIQSQGWRAPITVSTRSGFIVRGHGRLDAALNFGAELVPVDYQNYANEAEEWADLIADNRLSELAETDNVTLADLIAEMDTGEVPLILSGYTEDDIESILAAIAGDGDAESDGSDDVPGVPEIPMTRPGDMWFLGNHRLVCGDARDKATVNRLMGGDLAHMVFTDPPYGVAYEGTHDKAWDMIANDELKGDDLLRFLIPAFRNMAEHSVDDAGFYIWHGAMIYEEFIGATKAAGLMQKALIIWAKNNFVMRHNDYHQMHEPCIYAEKQGFKARFFGDRTNATLWRASMRNTGEISASVGTGMVVTDGMGNKLFMANKAPKGKKVRYFRLNNNETIYIGGDSANTTLWEIAKDTGIEHPTQKPVELAVRAIENSSRAGEIVLDLFGGSGTTLIGAEMTGRVAYLTELDPKYCDLIVDRYARVTGNISGHVVRDGRTIPYAEIKQQSDADNNREQELR